MGRGQAVKARDFESRIRRFESFRPSQSTWAGGAIRLKQAQRSGSDRAAMQNRQLKLFTGSAHPQLALEIAEHIGSPLGRASLKRFSDTEVSFQIGENIRGADVFILQPTCTPVDPHRVMRDDRRVPTIICVPYHGCHALFRLRSSGPEGQA